MNLRIIAAVMAIAATLSASATKREQRGTWMSALSGDWPNAKISSSNVERPKSLCLENLDTIQKSNFNTIYFHARIMCDALYNSAYEPWSGYVTTRGEECPLDPLGFLVENAHARGIEVYAWLNPYRYMNQSKSLGTSWGNNPLNYENSHPDWLIKWDNGSTMWTILNPALEEVKQRIVDVIADILSKYDVDGIVFDDFFYQNGLPMSYDAAQYNAYTAAGGTLSQADWRRENVNDMVRRVNAYIKSTKPWVRFGIGPAGVASGNNLPDVAAAHGIETCPGSDWQYNGIFSDPVQWLEEGSIDFISPQIYWNIGASSNFAAIAPWWHRVVKKFDRHCYVSQSLTSNLDNAASIEEFYNQIQICRTNDEQDASGMVYFCWKNLKNKTKKYNGKNVNLPTYLRYNVFSNKALQPICSWMPATCPGSISNLSRSGRTLTWTGVKGMRYTIYAVPKSLDPANFHKEACYLRGVSYSESYTIPEPDSNYPEYGIADADLDNYNYAVCIYDRYGNEYSAYFAGIAPASASRPTLTTPLNGAVAPPVFNFEWNGNSQMYEIIVARNADLSDIIYRREHAERSIAAADVATFEPGTTYYWAVVGRSNGVADQQSDVAQFTVDTFRILSPSNEASDCADNPTITWNELGSGVEYTLTIATDNAMSKQVYTTTSKSLKADIPAYTLSGNTTYYATVKATVNDREYTTNVSSFKTALMEGHVPVFINPTSDGQTIHSDEMVEVEPQRGITQLKIMIASSTSFSARSSYNGTFTKFETKTPALSEIKLGSATLVDGKTYYIRANVSYIGAEGSTVTTEWTEPRSFVYSAEQGAVATVKTVGAHYSAGTIVCNVGDAVTVYTADGLEAANGHADAAGRFDVAQLPTGVYIAKIAGAKKETIKFVKSE